MNTLVLLIGVLLCVAVVSGRNFDEERRHEKDLLSDIEGETKKVENRHRRRRWQMNYGYEYPQPMPAYYPERREQERNQDLLPKIVRLLEEISEYVKRPPPPPPPPQPIYVPYPVPYPYPQYIPCAPTNTNTNANTPNITNRFPAMEDTNQNWGFVTNEVGTPPPGDGSRPISFKPITPPSRPLMRPPPEVEHGSVQSDSQHTTQAPKFETETENVTCKAAVLSCCAGENKDTQMLCFANFGCAESFDSGKACEMESINQALAAFKAAYSPMP